MLISQNFKTISDMRGDALALLNEAESSSDPLFLMYRSKPKAVMLSLPEFQKLSSIYEDYLDSLEAQEFETKNKKKINWLSHQDIFS